MKTVSIYTNDGRISRIETPSGVSVRVLDVGAADVVEYQLEDDEPTRVPWYAWLVTVLALALIGLLVTIILNNLPIL